MTSICPRCPARLKDAADDAHRMGRFGASLDIGRDLSDEPVRPMNPAPLTEQQTTLSENTAKECNNALTDETEQDVKEIIRDHQTIHSKKNPHSQNYLSSHLRLGIIMTVFLIIICSIWYFSTFATPPETIINNPPLITFQPMQQLSVAETKPQNQTTLAATLVHGADLDTKRAEDNLGK